MQISKCLARWWLALLMSWLVWALVAPIEATTVEREQVRHDCPNIRVTHGVGSDLRTFREVVDLCAHR